MTMKWTRTGKWLGILCAGMLVAVSGAAGEASRLTTAAAASATAIKDAPQAIRLQPLATADRADGTALQVSAQNARPLRDADAEAEMELVVIENDADELRDVIRPRTDQDYADTALIFSNTTGRALRVRCKAWNRAGEGVARLATNVPARGVGYLLASDFSNGVDFVGRAHCRASSHVIASAVFLGPEITHLAVVSKASRRPGASDHQFPVVATY